MLSAQTPVAIFAFNRPDTTAITLRHLQSSEGFAGRPVYLFCDGPRPGRQGEDAAVCEVRQLLRTWAATNRAILCFSDENRGLRPSITSGVSRVLSEHRRAIVLEDDIVVSRSFLRYMDAALEKYEAVDNVWQVSGYFVPGFSFARRAGFLRMPACWGWGTWQHRWQNYQDDAASLREQVLAIGVSRFNIDGSYDFFNELSGNADGRLNTWHVRWYASMFLSNALAVYPARSLTRNIGFDHRGTHCHGGKMSEVFCRQRIWHGRPELPNAQMASETPELLKRQIRFHNLQAAVWSRSTLADRIARRLRGLLPQKKTSN